MLLYAVTIFLSAFLLFQVQPLIAKFVLPWFGGSAAIWSASLLFFQLVLLAGYTYAHLLVKYLKPKQQLKVHLPLLLISLATLPIIPNARWKPVGGSDPTLGILLMLAGTIGLPYMILSATSPLLQAWFVRTHAGVIPYRLFALSNFGSMLALLSYPFLVEPNIALHNQAIIWSVGFGVFALACAYAAWKSTPKDDSALPVASDVAAAEVPPPPSLGTILYWIGLAACASSLLLATTSHLTQNVAPIPLLWIAPLSIYLLSFILSFESDRIYQSWLFLPMGIVALALYDRGMTWYENNEDVITLLIPALSGAFFIACMICHGELAKRKPHPRYLTQFFLMVSVGGAIGGLFVAFVAPRVFSDYYEMPISIAVLALLMALAIWNEIPVAARLPVRIALLLAVGAVTWRVGDDALGLQKGYKLTVRDFYGVLRVRDDPPDPYWSQQYRQRTLIHGTINHGTQLLTEGGGRIATSYFIPTSGINRAIRAKGEDGPIRLGILGLGAGVTATLARAGDTLHYYEISPLIFDLAKKEFDFWEACPADKKLFMGDGRLTLEDMKEGENLDFLAMDAFTSDAVPMHLLTKEAFAIYARHLKPNGVIAINISNRYLNLTNVVASSAAENQFHGIMIYDNGEGDPYGVGNTWTLFNRDKSFFDHPNFADPNTQELTPDPTFRGWTDDYSNILNILNTNQ